MVLLKDGTVLGTGDVMHGELGTRNYQVYGTFNAIVYTGVKKYFVIVILHF